MLHTGTRPAGPGVVVSTTLIWTMVTIGTGGCTSSRSDERERLIVETYDAHKRLLRADRFLVESGGRQKMILRSDPEYKVIERLWQIRQLAECFPETSLGGYHLACSYRLHVMERNPDGTDTPTAYLAHYSPEAMVYTKEYGYREIPERIEKEMVALWGVLLSAKGHPKEGETGEGEKPRATVSKTTQTEGVRE